MPVGAANRPVRGGGGEGQEVHVKVGQITDGDRIQQAVRQGVGNLFRSSLYVYVYTHIHLTYILMRAIVILSSEQGVERMKTVNALTVRNKLGEILETLTKTGEPILVSKGRQVRAVLITPEDFQKRFLDLQAAEAKERLLQSIKEVRAGKVVQRSSLEVLRELRGYRQ